MKKIAVLLFVLFVLLNEIILRFSNNLGAFMYLILMSLTLFVLSREDDLNDFSQMIVILLVVPLVRVAGLFIDLPYIWKVSLGYSMLLFLGIYYVLKFKIDIGSDFDYLWVFPFVGGIAIIVGILGNVLFSSGGNLILISVLPLIVFSEEIFFRGLMQNSIEKSCGVIYSVVAPALIYGALSIYLGIGMTIFFLIMNIFCGIVYSSTKNIFLGIFFNLIVSAMVFVVPNLS
jgi:membrane protease YdiL (CAAX protease family)